MRIFGPSVLALVCIVSFAQRSHAMDGSAWYTACLKWAHSKKAEIEASSVEVRLSYRECQIEAIRVFCEQEWHGDATGVGDRLQAAGQSREAIARLFADRLGTACPNLLNMPLGGPPALAVVEIERNGGPTFTERFLPSSSMLRRAYQGRYPQCSAQRKTLGLVAEAEVCRKAWMVLVDE